MVWTGLIWLRRRASAGLFQTRRWGFGFHKIRYISWLRNKWVCKDSARWKYVEKKWNTHYVNVQTWKHNCFVSQMWYAVILPVSEFDSSGFKFEMESLGPWQSLSYFLSFETYPVLFTFLCFPFFWLDLFIFTIRFYFICRTTRRNILNSEQSSTTRESTLCLLRNFTSLTDHLTLSRSCATVPILGPQMINFTYCHIYWSAVGSPYHSVCFICAWFRAWSPETLVHVLCRGRSLLWRVQVRSATFMG